MNLSWKMASVLRAVFQKREESDLDRELAHHLYHLTAEYERRGYTPQEAARLARREFGGYELTKDRCRDEARFAWCTGLRQDLVFGWRMLRRTPVVTLAAIVSLALAIGANTAILSLMDFVLWRDLPVPQPRQLVNINWQGHSFKELADGASGSAFPEEGFMVADFFSYPAYQIMRQKLAGKASIAAFTFPNAVSVSFAGNPNVAKQRSISGNFLSTLAVQPFLGRLLIDSDDDLAAPNVVLLSYRFWAQQLGSPADIVGRTIVVDNKPAVVVGVINSTFFGLTPGDPTDIYAPLQKGFQRFQNKPLSDNRFWGVSLLARRLPAYTEAQMQPELDAIFASTWAAKPKNEAGTPHIRLENGSRGLGLLRRNFQNPLWVLAGLVILLLLIACSNIANLLLSRAAAREHEVATRIALGCSRLRLARQFMAESAMLAGLGGAAGILVAYVTQNLLGRYLVFGHGDSIPINAGLNPQLILIAFLITGAALLLFGLFPAWRTSCHSTAHRLKSNASSVIGSAAGHWSAGRLLTLGQMAMSIVLVMCAVSFTRNLLAIESADPGFNRQNIILFDIRPGTSGYDGAKLEHFYFNLERRLAETPGVNVVGLASVRPMDLGGRWEDLRVAGYSDIRNASINGISPDYLSVYSPRLISGRGFQWSDIASAHKVAIVSEDLAKKIGGNALGKRISFFDRPPGEAVPVYEIIGIAPAMAATSMKDRPDVVWLPLDKETKAISVVLRTSQSPAFVLPAVRKTIAQIDPNLPMIETITMEEQISRGLQRERMFATICSVFGALALLLSVVGLYGVMAYNTARRRNEIGIRLALGAKPRQVVTMIVREGMLVAVLGLLLGAPVIWLGAKYIQKELFQMQPLDPVSLSYSTAALLAAALVAVIAPALRASKLDPSQTLRQD